MAPLKSPTNILTNEIIENSSNLRRNGNAAWCNTEFIIAYIKENKTTSLNDGACHSL